MGPGAVRGECVRSETSAGGVVYRQGAAGIEIALGDQRDRLPGAHNVRLPKGRPARGENLEQTALREVAEETGLDARIVAPLGSVDYVYADARGKVDKKVHFFLMELASTEAGPTDGELERVAWVDIDEAERRLSFTTEQEIVARAREALAKP